MDKLYFLLLLTLVAGCATISEGGKKVKLNRKSNKCNPRPSKSLWQHLMFILGENVQNGYEEKNIDTQTNIQTIILYIHASFNIKFIRLNHSRIP